MQYIEAIKNIDRFQANTNETDKHHIIPLSCGGTNDEDNIIYVTPQLHGYLHYLYDKENDKRTSKIFLNFIRRKLQEDLTYEDFLECNSRVKRRNEKTVEVQKAYWSDPEKRAYRIQQFSEAKKGRVNCCYQRVWVHKKYERHRVTKEHLQEYLDQGYKLGQKE